MKSIYCLAVLVLLKSCNLSGADEPLPPPRKIEPAPAVLTMRRPKLSRSPASWLDCGPVSLPGEEPCEEFTLLDCIISCVMSVFPPRS